MSARTLVQEFTVLKGDFAAKTEVEQEKLTKARNQLSEFLADEDEATKHTITTFLNHQVDEWQPSVGNRLQDAVGEIQTKKGGIARVQHELNEVQQQLKSVKEIRRGEEHTLRSLTGQLSVIKDIVLSGISNNTSPRKKAKLRRSIAVLDGMNLSSNDDLNSTYTENDSPARFTRSKTSVKPTHRVGVLNTSTASKSATNKRKTPAKSRALPHFFNTRKTGLMAETCSHCGMSITPRTKYLRCTTCQVSVHNTCESEIAPECGSLKRSKTSSSKVTSMSSISMIPPTAQTIQVEKGEAVPKIIKLCTAEIEATSLEVSNLYIDLGSTSNCESLYHRFFTSSTPPNLACADATVVAGCVVLYLRNLTSALIPSSEELLATNKMAGLSERIDAIIESMADIPLDNFRLLQHLAKHLNRILRRSQKNHITASRLSTALAGVVMRGETKHSQQQTKVFETILMFDEDDWDTLESLVTNPDTSTTHDDSWNASF